MNQEVNLIRELISPVFNKYNIRAASLVGSAARGDHTPESDYDIVIDIDEPISLLTFSRIKIELEDIFHKKIDLIERSAIKPVLKKYLLKDEIAIYG